MLAHWRRGVEQPAKEESGMRRGRLRHGRCRPKSLGPSRWADSQGGSEHRESVEIPRDVSSVRAYHEQERRLRDQTMPRGGYALRPDISGDSTDRTTRRGRHHLRDDPSESEGGTRSAMIARAPNEDGHHLERLSRVRPRLAWRESGTDGWQTRRVRTQRASAPL